MGERSFLEETLKRLEVDLLEQSRALSLFFEDARLTVRFVGEFSSGKSRVIREILSGVVPNEFLPVSDLKRETLLPLEITYGEAIELTEIQRIDDFHKPKEIHKLKRFPQRGEIAEGAIQEKHRLLLSIPLASLLVREDSKENGQGKVVKKLRLIDTAGWNSGEVDETAQELEDSYPYATVYVVNANRLESKNEEEELTKLFEALNLATLLTKDLKLIVFVTRWEAAHSSLQESFEARTKKLGEEIFTGYTFRPHFFYQDFDRMTAEEKEAMRQRFWSILEEPEAVKELAKKKDEQKIRLPVTEQMVSDISNLAKTFLEIRQSLENLKREDKFLPAWNVRRLAPYKNKIASMLWDELQQKLTDYKYPPFSPNIPSTHPLAPWWNREILAIFHHAFQGYCALLQQFKVAFREIESKIIHNERDIFDVNDYLFSRIGALYEDVKTRIQKGESFFLPSILAQIKRWEEISFQTTTRPLKQAKWNVPEEVQQIFASLLFVSLLKEGLTIL